MQNVPAEAGNRLIHVKSGATAVRTVRTALLQLAYAMRERPETAGFLVLPEVGVTRKRLEEEWRLAASVLRPDLLQRVTICIGEEDRFIGIPRDPDAETQVILSKAVRAEYPLASSPVTRSDSNFVITKVLLHQWLTDGKAVTTNWLAKTSGYSYPTVASTLHHLGSLIERESDRRIRLRSFPREEFARMLAVSDRARSTVRFADLSGQSRSVESHLRRLEKLGPANVGIGGVLGAKHYHSDLDLVGTPRLDISLHCPGKQMDLHLIETLDPALKRVEDPRAPANLVVHAVHHAESLFRPREDGLSWADPVECLLDLYEARLEAQANEFLQILEHNRPNTP